MKIRQYIFLVILFITAVSNVLPKDKLMSDSIQAPILQDTISKSINSTNSTTITDFEKLPAYRPGAASDIDTVVRYKAKDTVKFNVHDRMMYLVGDTKLDYSEQHLSSEIMVINFNTSVLSATGIKDSNDNIIGFPKFSDKGESYVGERILYNFKSKQGTITLGETELSEGFYFGSKIKRISESELFVKDGCYTTCDAAHPHFYFGSPEMKVIASDRIFLDPIIFYVEDMPVFILPIGLFFPNKGGRQSGIMIPSFYFSNTRGVVLQDMGYYLALSDYYDTQFNADYYSKGGYNLKNATRWKLLDVFDGRLDLSYGKTKFDPDEKDYSENYSIKLRHNQVIDPQSKIDVNVSFMSDNNIRNTISNDYNQLLKQNITSNASYSKSFDNGSSISLAFNRDQNIQTKDIRQTFPQFNASLPQLQPIKSIVPPGTWMPDWLRDLTLRYSGSASYYEENINIDSSRVFNTKKSIRHNPSVSISPKLGYLNINPFFSFSANNYFRRLTKTYNPIDSGFINHEEKGFFTEYNYNYGVDVSTKLFGIITPKIWGINALRHMVQPSIGYSASPDLSDKDQGFWGYVVNESNNDTLKYSRYELDDGGLASSRESRSIRYSLLNSFEAKIFQNDTIPDKNVEFFRWTFNGNYDFMKDSIKFSDISMQFRTPQIGGITMSTSANFTMYDEARRINSDSTAYTGSWTRINTFLYENGKSPLRMTNFNLQLSTSYSSDGSSSDPSYNQGSNLTSTNDSLPKKGLGDRFKQRYEYEDEIVDLYGDHSPGFSPINIPWNINLGLSYVYTKQFAADTVPDPRINLTTSFSFKLAETWSFNGSFQYDLWNYELIAPAFTIAKDMHCWQLSFQWWPIGYNAGFYLMFNVKAPQLKDLKIEKKDSPLLR